MTTGFESEAAKAPPTAPADALLTQSHRSAAGQGGDVRGVSAAPLGKAKAQVIAEIREENDWKNNLILFWLPDGWLEVRGLPIGICQC